jgi:hypothetical protein
MAPVAEKGRSIIFGEGRIYRRKPKISSNGIFVTGGPNRMTRFRNLGDAKSKSLGRTSRLKTQSHEVTKGHKDRTKKTDFTSQIYTFVLTSFLRDFVALL